MARVWIAFVLSLACCSARAGGLSVMPTLLDFAAGRTVQSVLLTNTSAQSITVETQVLVWPEGAAGQLANDLVVSPAVVTLAPDQRVRLRVGLLRTLDASREHAYRLYFTELPAPAPLQGAGIGVRLRVGIPLFVAPAEAAPQALQWQARASDEGWVLVAHNRGNVHARLSAVRLSDRSGALALPHPYVLAHSSLVLPLAGPASGGDPTTQKTTGPAAGVRVRWSEGPDERESPLDARP